MSEYTTPISTAFELQRSTIEQGRQMFERSIEMQQNMTHAFVGSMGSQEDAQRQGVELSRKTLHTYLNTVEATVPGLTGPVNEVRAMIDEQYDALLDAHSESFDVAEDEFERGIDTYDEMMEEYLRVLSSQTELLLDAHEDMEYQTVDTFEQVRLQIEELQSDMDVQSKQFQERFEEQAELFQERFEEQVEQFEALQERAIKLEDA